MENNITLRILVIKLHEFSKMLKESHNNSKLSSEKINNLVQ